MMEHEKLILFYPHPPFLPHFYIHVQNVLCGQRESLVLTFLDLYQQHFYPKIKMTIYISENLALKAY